MAHEKLILNRYRPIAQAGSGGFATVQVAWDTRIQRRVAIKIIQLNESQAFQAAQAVYLPEETRRFSRRSRLEREEGQGISGAHTSDAPIADALHPPGSQDAPEPSEQPPVLPNLPGLEEARTAAMLSDPNIVGVYDFEVQGTCAYLIMEYVDGMTLAKLLEYLEDDITLDIVAAVFTSIAHALTVAHDNQVLHLDIKPDNVLIDHQGRVKVTDFGLATLSDAAGFGAASGGTIGYMPLEQMRQESLDARCDEWALASVTYEMLTGSNPFMAADLKEAEAAIEDAELVLPSQYWKELDPEADDVLFYALDPLRDERYDNVEDFAEELTPFLGDPEQGRRELSVIVGQASEEQEDEYTEVLPEQTKQRRSVVSLLKRVGSWVGLQRWLGLLARLWSAGSAAMLLVACAALVEAAADSGTAAIAGALTDAVAALPLGTNEAVLLWLLLAVSTICSLIKPHLGALVAYVLLSFSTIVCGAIPLGIVLLLMSIAWWLFVGRRDVGQACAVLSVALVGALGCAQMVPLLAACLLPLVSSEQLERYKQDNVDDDESRYAGRHADKDSSLQRRGARGNGAQRRGERRHSTQGHGTAYRIASAALGSSVGKAVSTSLLSFAALLVLAAFGSDSLLGWDAAGALSAVRDVITSSGASSVTVITTATLSGATSIGSFAFEQSSLAAALLQFVQQPDTWCIGISWLFGAGICAALNTRGGRSRAAMAAGLGFTFLLIGVCMGAWLASDMSSGVPAWPFVLSTAGAGLLALVLGQIRVRLRKEIESYHFCRQ